MKSKIIPVTFDTLQRVFHEQKFQGNLGDLVRIMDADKIEARFVVYKDLFSNGFYIGDVGRGSLDGLSPGTVDDEVPFEEYHEMIDTHVHEKLLTPSSFYEGGKGDLYGWNALRDDSSASYGFDNRIINIICKKANGKNIRLFVTQPTSRKPLSDLLLENVASGIYGEDDCERPYLEDNGVVNRFNRTGLYRAAILTLNARGFSKPDLEKLKQFEYSLDSIKQSEL